MLAVFMKILTESESGVEVVEMDFPGYQNYGHNRKRKHTAREEDLPPANG